MISSKSQTGVASLHPEKIGVALKVQFMSLENRIKPETFTQIDTMGLGLTLKFAEIFKILENFVSNINFLKLQEAIRGISN